MEFTSKASTFHKTVLDWYQVAQRPLPWRTEPSLYRTVVSELMTQQTQIRTMLPYFERWMQRFPDFFDLAEAPEEDVLKHWEGLGYYSRARNLHKLAKTYVAAETKPETRAEWLEMPGIGPYTSAAIASIVFELPEAVVDGNVVRILARLSNDTRTFKSNGDAVKAFTPLAEELLNPDNPGDHNQAMMELGATVCLKRKPLCTICPVSELCEGRTSRAVDDIPRIERRATEQISVNRAWIVKDGHILLYRIPESSGQLSGQNELPELKKLGLSVPKQSPLATRKRSITHRRITEKIYSIETSAELPKNHIWIDLDQIESVTLSGPHRRWISELLAEHKDPNRSDSLGRAFHP